MPELKKPELLIVDDSPLIHKKLQQMIKKHMDIAVFEAEDAWAAIRLIGNHDVDLILLDIYMPDKDGFEVAKIIRSQRKSSTIPIIFISGADLTPEQIKLGLDIGGIDYLKKPFTEDELARFLNLYFRFIHRERDLNKQLHEINKKLEHEAELNQQVNNRLQISEVKLKQINAEKDKYFSIVSNELLAQIGIANKYASNLFKNFNKMNDEKIQLLVEDIHYNIESSHKLLENLSYWADIKSERIDFNIQDIDLRDAAQNIIDDFEPLAAKKDISLMFEIPSDMLVRADRKNLEFVLRNLISNAVKYSREEGEVVVDARDVSRFIEISIRDTGIGMSEEELGTLFKVNDQRSKLGTNNETGSGLGLVICKELIEKMNGKIYAESKLNSGTTIKILLPGKMNININLEL